MRGERGGALLAVLWLAAALSAIALSVAVTVRGEIERTSTALEGVKAYYLAEGAVDRAILYILWGPESRRQDGSRRWVTASPVIPLRFPSGEAVVEIIPESTKININEAQPQLIERLLEVLGVPPAEALTLTQAIIDWRTGNPAAAGPMDEYYLNQTPSFRARHASLEEVEELLLVRGMMLPLFYGRYERNPEGKLFPVSGLRDCVTVYPVSGSGMDINTVAPEVMAAIGVPAQTIDAIVAQRRLRPFTQETLNAIRPALGPGGGRIQLGGDTFFTLRATARMYQPDGRLSDLRRTVSATVRYNNPKLYPDNPYTILRWRETDPPARLLFEAWTR